jgi:hypothetical protein
MSNPTMDWWTWVRGNVDPNLTPNLTPNLLAKLLGRSIVGKVPYSISNAQIRALFETVSLTVKNTDPQ